MNEWGPADPFDERLEWDRDGQYYHYLTKWMHALNRVSRVTGDTVYNWTDHRDINMVMLATSLSPDGYLTL